MERAHIANGDGLLVHDKDDSCSKFSILQSYPLHPVPVIENWIHLTEKHFTEISKDVCASHNAATKLMNRLDSMHAYLLANVLRSAHSIAGHPGFSVRRLGLLLQQSCRSQNEEMYRKRAYRTVHDFQLLGLAERETISAFNKPVKATNLLCDFYDKVQELTQARLDSEAPKPAGVFQNGTPVSEIITNEGAR